MEIIPVEGEIVEFIPPVISEADRIWDVLSSQVSDVTKELYGPDITKFAEWWEDYSDYRPAVALSKYLEYLLSRDYARSTINRKRATLRSFFKTAMVLDYISHEEFAKVETIPALVVQGRKRRVWLSMDQMQALLDAPLDREMHPHVILRDRAMIAMFLGSGLRRSEVVSIKLNQIVLSGETYVYQNVSRKHHKTQEIISIEPWAVQLINKYTEALGIGDDEPIMQAIYKNGKSSGSLSARRVNDVITYYGQMIGVKISPHDLRSSYARAMVDGGGDLAQLQLQLGHQSITTTQHYVNQLIEPKEIVGRVQLEV